MEGVGKRIQRLRKAAGMTQADLATAIGKARAYVGQIETGSRTGSAHTLKRIAEAIGCDLATLLGDVSPDTTAVAERLGARLRSIREARGLSLRQLGERMGKAASTLSAVETGNANLTVANMLAYADALGVRFSDILGSGPLPSADGEEVTVSVGLDLATALPPALEAYARARAPDVGRCLSVEVDHEAGRATVTFAMPEES